MLILDLYQKHLGLTEEQGRERIEKLVTEKNRKSLHQIREEIKNGRSPIYDKRTTLLIRLGTVFSLTLNLAYGGWLTGEMMLVVGWHPKYVRVLRVRDVKAGA